MTLSIKSGGYVFLIRLDYESSNLNIAKKELKKNFSFSLNHRFILFLTVSFVIKSME